jgi:hypothetical protein
MLATRRLESQLKRERVDAAVAALAATGQPLSIDAIALHADVSRNFIYSHPELRAQIAQRARQPSWRAAGAAVADGHVTVASLRASPSCSAATSPASSTPAAGGRTICAASCRTPRRRSLS